MKGLLALAVLALSCAPALAVDLTNLSAADQARVDRQCDVLRFRQAGSLGRDEPAEPGPDAIVTDPSGYWANSANATDAALSKVDLNALTMRQCREAGFYDN